MLRICFVKHGTMYGPEYVNILASMISRNLADGTPGTFECFTDDPAGIAPHINIRAIPPGYDGWWAKLWLFEDGHFDDGDRIVYFDLDTIVFGPLDDIVKYDGPFAILRDFFKPYNDVQSAVMAWPANTQSATLRKWEGLGYPRLPAGDQQLIQMSLDERGIAPDFFQDLYPGLFVSWKSGMFKRVPPKGCSVVCFHGQPKPHNCGSTWVDGVWKIDGSSAFEIEQFCNTEETQIAENIQNAMSLDHPWLAPIQAHDETAIIVGGAPSLKSTVSELGRGVIFATNNTARFLQDAQIRVDYHVLIDAREENAKFVTNEPPTKGYLLGSQCHRSVFDAAGSAPITVFHPKINGIADLVKEDQRPKCIVGGGSTVCLKAIAIAYIMGFRKFRLFGMDSSYSGDEHHAYPQAMNDDDLVVTVQVDDRTFITSPWMVAQADEFEDLLVELLRLGCQFEIFGEGLIPYVAQETISNLVSPAVNQRAQAIFAQLPDGPVIGAEIGVFAGELSAKLLRRPDLTLYMVDSWKGDGEDYKTDTGDFHAGLKQWQQDRCKEMAAEAIAFAGDRARIIAKSSADAARDVPDGSLDFVFIDADHSYDGCMADIAAWLPKLKPDGILAGHDYDNPGFPQFGVKRAVDEFAGFHGCTVFLGENLTWFIRNTGLRKAA